jgi:hypothetical protein
MHYNIIPFPNRLTSDSPGVFTSGFLGIAFNLDCIRDAGGNAEEDEGFSNTVFIWGTVESILRGLLFLLL